MKEEHTQSNKASGNCNIEIDIDNNVLDMLVDTYARDNLCEASLEQYDETIKTSGDRKEAIHAAIINDMIIDLLTSYIEKAGTKLDDNAQNV